MVKISKRNNKNELFKKMKKFKVLYFMLLPGLIFFLIFKIIPVYGLLIAFKDFYPGADIFESPFVGLKHFKIIFGGGQFLILLKNTLSINGLKLLVGFPSPIILALMFNALRGKRIKKAVQIVSYFPQFLSWVVVYGIIYSMLNVSGGFVNQLLREAGKQTIPFLSDYKLFYPMIITTYVWKNIGWGSIVYVAALANINPEYYEAADIDGAVWWHKLFYITLPLLSPTIAVIFMIQMGNMLFGDFEQNLMFMSNNYDLIAKGEIFETYTFRMATNISGSYGLGAAVGIIQSIFGTTLVIFSNKVIRKINGKGLW